MKITDKGRQNHTYFNPYYISYSITLRFCFMMMIENYRSIQQFPTKGNQSFDNFLHIKLCALLWVLGETKWGFLHLCLSIKEQTDMRENHFSKDFRTTNYLHNMPTQEVANCDV